MVICHIRHSREEPDKQKMREKSRILNFFSYLCIMNKKHILPIILLTILPFLSTAQTLTAYRNTVSNGYNFWVCTPKDYDSLQSETPIILFLHGASLCGNNLERVRRYGPLDALAMGRQIDALIIAPQNPGGAWNPERINNVVDWVYSHYAGDTNRLYVLGMSLGGYGTIDYSAAHPERIAAAMALCGGGNPKSYCGLNDLPLWIIHGTADRAVGVSQSQKVVSAMAKCGDSPRLIFTKLPGVDHGGLARAFYISETYDWLFSHRLDDPDRPVNRDYSITVDRLHKAYKDIDRKANHLVVRNGKSSTTEKASNTSEEKASTSKSNSGDAQYHTIKKGDTLSAIARRYHTTVKKLCQMNNMSETTILKLGKKLRVK